MSRNTWLLATVAGLGGVLAVVACGSSDSSGSGGSSGTGATGGSAGTSGAAGGGAGGTSGSGGAAGGDGAACVQNAAAETECKNQGAGTCAPVLDCACANCACELGTCQADPGCVAIRECAQQMGCSGTDCLGPCGSVISAHPDSTTAALAVGNCVDAHQCPVTCSDGGATDAGTD